ncbi:hypothetical protein PR048_007092 [Dryococelus australis]|uniref:Uncharacterized protein n=1 Tax=Dryococelus australis TaxID=614101 RepID=A0ABQ9ICN4_9NEOP|nr:hypothetical protein PR048_007092 [Dryococelus australis]
MGVIKMSMEQRRNERAGETGDPRENPPTNGIVRHDSHMRKFGVTQIALVGGEQANRSATRVSRALYERRTLVLPLVADDAQ